MASLLCFLFIHGLVVVNAFPLKRAYTLQHRSSFLIWQSVDHLTSSNTASTLPTVLPFDAKDFTRDDVPLPSSNTTLEDSKKIVESNLKQFEDIERRKVWRRSYLEDEEEEYEYYRSPIIEEEDEEEDRVALINSNTTNSVASTAQSPPTWSSFLVDLYVDKPGDGRKKRQARFVARSITTISILFGLTFSLICYLAPGKFVTFRGSNVTPVEDNRFFFDDTIDNSSPSITPQIELPLKSIEGRLEEGKELPSPINPRVPLSPEVGGKESVPGRSAEI